MNGGQHEVAGHGGPQANLGRFRIADFADHDHVGVLPQERPQGGGERQADLGLHLTWFMPLNLYSTGSSTVQCWYRAH